MPRKTFVTDLQGLIHNFNSRNVANLQIGPEDGTFTFVYELSGKSAPNVTVQALVSDVGDYPTSHQFFVFTTSGNVSPTISSVLDDLPSLKGMTLSRMLTKVVKLLNKATIGSQDNPVDLDDPDAMMIDGPELDTSDPDSSGMEDAGGWSPESPQHPSHIMSKRTHVQHGQHARSADIDRIRVDLRATKAAGFRVGHLGHVLDGGQEFFITVACRVAKLGISDEALQAWHLDPSHYFLLILRYTAGYRTTECLTGTEASGAAKTVRIRVGLSQRYKIKLEEAIDAFSKTKDKGKGKSKEPDCAKSPETPKIGGLGSLFMGQPLEELLNDHLVPLLKYRMARGLPWAGAEEFYNDHQGRDLRSKEDIAAKYWAEDVFKVAKTLPILVTADHLASDLSTHATKTPSFPLLAMQFALRHLVRCTEFCLVCHCKVEGDFEALKPYVCSKPLCLYQYMALGFGPSIEHEITSQPHVVDLLVSFCYSSASTFRLSSLPVGMGLSVPAPSLIPIREHSVHAHGSSGTPRNVPIPRYPSTSLDVPQKPVMPLIESRKHKAKYSRRDHELIFPQGAKIEALRTGSWIYLMVPGNPDEGCHCQVIDALYPIIRLGPSVLGKSSNINKSRQRNSIGLAVHQQRASLTGAAINLQAPTPAATPPQLTQYVECEFVIYEQNFDDLDNKDKQDSICTLLDTLPSILRMKEFLESGSRENKTFQNWADRISPAALGLLRWIIASNRSCIIQVDNIEGKSRKSEERVSGMPEWIQFRFAQGAPDKEQRFITAVRERSGNLDSRYPTLFAWHGSPLHNWHGIVREGLHFQHKVNGRAFGDGVYHALDVKTSLGYSGMYTYSPTSVSDGGTIRWDEWSRSDLRISQAIALNEIVNSPSQFVSKHPYLVVSQLDWIQSRYLFVKCDNGQKPEDKVPSQVYDQDPDYAPRGSNREKIVIPITAVSKSRRPTSKTVKNGNKKAKITSGLAESEFDGTVHLSDDTDIEDIMVLISDDEPRVPQALSSQTKGKGKASPEQPATPQSAKPQKPESDFVPGVLDHTTLPLIQEPAYGSPIASRALQRELAGTLRVQSTNPAHELGWYIDPELITNVYQWIIELHSFEAHLPLAQDMKAKDLKSVVIEMRFGKDYPISPPFVRIIRPRFLSFTAGGGGHVTSGGALCMELLTNNGWSAVSSIESVLLQVRLAISSTEPKPARLESGPVRDYGVGEAVLAFIRACRIHGWTVPQDFHLLGSE